MEYGGLENSGLIPPHHLATSYPTPHSAMGAEALDPSEIKYPCSFDYMRPHAAGK